MSTNQAVVPVFQKQDPVFYAGDELHRIKQHRVQQALAASGFDAFIFFKAEAVRYITDFYVKGFRPFMEPEYMVQVVKGKAPVVAYAKLQKALIESRSKPEFQDYIAKNQLQDLSIGRPGEDFDASFSADMAGVVKLK